MAKNPLADAKQTQAFEPDHGLRDKLGADVDLRKDIFTEDRIAKSQQVIDKAAADFFEDNKADLQAMEQDCQALESAGEQGMEQMLDIAQRAQLLKSQSETLGYVLIAKVSDSLYRYCSIQHNTKEHVIVVIRKHIDTLRVAFHECLKGDGGKMGEELIESLNKLIQKFS